MDINKKLHICFGCINIPKFNCYSPRVVNDKTNNLCEVSIQIRCYPKPSLGLCYGSLPGWGSIFGAIFINRDASMMMRE